MRREHAKICAITDSAEIGTLSVNALAKCSRCGAASNDPSSLCDPVQLPEAGQLGD